MDTATSQERPPIYPATRSGVPGVLMLIILLWLVGCGVGEVGPDELDDLLVFEAVDPLDKVLQETAFFKGLEAVADVARGEHATLQFVIRSNAHIENLRASVEAVTSEQGTLTEVKVGYVGYVRVGRSTPTPSRDRIVSPSGYYPDPILEEASIDLRKDASQPIWVSVAIPKEAEPGTYTGSLSVIGRINGRDFETSKGFSINVYSPVIERTSLWVTNWFTLSAQQLGRMNGGVPVEPFSETYWTLTRKLARKMAEYRQNVALLSPLRLASYSLEEGTYSIDFANFDRTVELFIEEGVVGRIEGGHIGRRESTWTTPFVVYVPIVKADTTVFELYPITDEPARSFYQQFIPALTAHLKEKGWDAIYMQHLADEPITANIDSYIEIARFVKALAPELRVVEACHTRDLERTVDVWVPQLNFLHDDYDFYDQSQQQGDEVWFYTCLAPQGEYANRFIELPLIKTRILHWINYRYRIPGYLHWGLNHWRGDPFDETTGIITESGNVLPGGDAWIIYPTEGGVLSSIRLEAMRDGIVDYELLKMLERHRPEEARELARQVVYRFDLYDVNVEAFRAKRRRILELLADAS